MIETGKLNREKIKKYLSEGKRFDGRRLDDFRKIEIETGISKNAEGSAKVRLGKTEVMVGVKMDTATPFPDTPTKGNLITNAELTPLSSPNFESGPPKFPAIELGRVIDRGVRESKYIDFEKLCIKEGEKVWNVFIDIYTLNYDGNLLDAASIATLVALKNAKIPVYDEESEKVLHEHSDKSIPLSGEAPLSLTIYKIGGNLLIDPTKEEEETSEARLTTGGVGEKFFSMQKGEKGTFSIEEMNKALDLATKTRKKITESLKGQI